MYALLIVFFWTYPKSRKAAISGFDISVGPSVAPRFSALLKPLKGHTPAHFDLMNFILHTHSLIQYAPHSYSESLYLAVS